MKIYECQGLIATINGNHAEVIDHDTAVWYGNVPDCTTARDVYNMYLAQQKSPANRH